MLVPPPRSGWKACEHAMAWRAEVPGAVGTHCAPTHSGGEGLSEDSPRTSKLGSPGWRASDKGAGGQRCSSAGEEGASRATGSQVPRLHGGEEKLPLFGVCEASGEEKGEVRAVMGAGCRAVLRGPRLAEGQPPRLGAPGSRGPSPRRPRGSWAPNLRNQRCCWEQAAGAGG